MAKYPTRNCSTLPAPIISKEPDVPDVYLTDMKDKGKIPSARAPALEGGLTVLDQLSESPSGRCFSDIVKALPFSKATTVRVLRILTDRGYAAKDVISGNYVMGPKMMGAASDDTHIRLWKYRVAPFLKECSGLLANTCLLFLWDGFFLQSIAKEMHPRSIVMQEIGSFSNSFADSPWGWIILSDVVKIDEPASRKLGIKTIKDRDFDWQWIEFYRQHHCAYDDAHFFPDVRRLAVPLLHGNGLIGILAVGGTKSTIPDDQLDQIASELASYADQIADTWV